MTRRRPLSAGWIIVAVAPLILGGRVFPASRFSIDDILYRPDTPEVPFGSTGRRGSSVAE